MSTSNNSVAQATITSSAAHRAVGQAVQAAQAASVAVNIGVVDTSGILMAFLRMPGGPIHSVEIAIDKAYTAVSFGLATSQWHLALQDHSAPVREGIVLRPRMLIACSDSSEKRPSTTALNRETS